MKLRITLDLGPINAELSGENREELQEELLEFVEFIEQNNETFEGIKFVQDHSGEKTELEGGETPPTVTKSSHSEDQFGDVPEKTDIDQETLDRFFDIDASGEEPPYLNFDAAVLGESGTSRSEKQMRGSLILLTLWRECVGVETVTSSDLKDALRVSGVDDTNLYNMYGFNDNEGNRYFRRDGTGANTEVSLTLPGKREGYDQIQRTVEQLESGGFTE